MILYKYISEDSLEYIFVANGISIKFTPFCDFNDPFESYGASIAPHDEGSLIHLTMRHEINNKLACLCLSKDPLNVLMWSHYADKHKGFVIGIDTEDAGFEDEANLIITAKKGDMDYRGERDNVSVSVTHENIFDEHVSRKLLLSKSLHWAYENEVRIIKRTALLDNQSGHLIHKIENRCAVKELYVGINNDNYKSVIMENSCLENLILNGNVNLYLCDFKEGTWDLDKRPIIYRNPIAEHAMHDVFESLKDIIMAIDRNKVNGD